MSATTIKVPADLRDLLKRQAAKHQRTLAEHLAAMARREERDQRWHQLRGEMEASSPDEQYRSEFEDWQSDALR